MRKHNIDIQEVIRLNQEKISISEIARRLSVHENTILTRLKKIGYKCASVSRGHPLKARTFELRMCICGCGRSFEVDTTRTWLNRKYWKSSCAVGLSLKSKVPPHYKQGTYLSVKAGKKIRFQSSYELAACKQIELDPTIRTYDRGRFGIPYSLNGKDRNYYPDFILEYVDGSRAVLEIKPKGKVREPEVQAKIVALEKYCTTNRLKRLMWTEQELFSCT